MRRGGDWRGGDLRGGDCLGGDILLGGGECLVPDILLGDIFLIGGDIFLIGGDIFLIGGDIFLGGDLPCGGDLFLGGDLPCLCGGGVGYLKVSPRGPGRPPGGRLPWLGENDRDFLYPRSRDRLLAGERECDLFGILKINF